MTDVHSAARALAAVGGIGALVTRLPDHGGGRLLVDAVGRVVAADPGVVATPEELAAVVDRVGSERSGVISAAEAEWFVDVIAPPPTLRIFGAGPIAEALSRLASAAGFKVVVGDPRPAHARSDRYPDAAEVSCGWPDDLIRDHPIDRRSFVVSLLHAERFEDVLLPLVLHSEAAYVGALGSRATHADRLQRLRGAGFSVEEVARIHGPVGLSIGAVTPEEIAVSILAEMVQVRRGRG